MSSTKKLKITTDLSLDMLNNAVAKRLGIISELGGTKSKKIHILINKSLQILMI